ncbi:MAG: hypothetical protein QHJ73_09135, partial [Armatimonadota bacterium]|nr:hypothetical protein [Armatimonadota bacterium]
MLSGSLAVLALVALPPLTAANAATQGLMAEVRSVHGTPLLLINGRPSRPLFFFGSLRAGGSAVPIRIGTEWRRFQTEFVMPEDQQNAATHVRVGGSPGTVWVDQVSLTAADAPETNLLGAPTFSPEWERRWRLFVKTELGARATARVEGDALRIEMGDGGSEPWHVHLYHPGLHLRKGVRYTFAVRLRAAAPRDADLLVVEQGGNWTHYTGPASPVPREIQRAAATGIHIHSFGVPLCWPAADGTTNWAPLDRLVETVLAADPEGLLVPRFGMEPPAHWKTRHPDQLMRYDTGPGRLVSVASASWRRDACAALRAFVQHLEEKYGNRILGYHPCGQNTGEWFYEDSWSRKVNCLEQPMVEGFRAWLRARYPDEAALRAAWSEPGITFATADPPTTAQRLSASLGVFRDPATEQRAIDFHAYQQAVMVEPLEEFARVIKEAT